MCAAPKGYSLHIGLNFVDPAFYEGWDGELIACEADADDMQTLASSAGYSTRQLIRQQATRAAVIDAIRGLAGTAQPGDICLISYSGHGGRIPDLTGDESDAFDETWCLYDGQLLDDELEVLWHEFKADVRILVVSDSCHSETVARGLPFGMEGLPVRLPFKIRTPPRAVLRRVYMAHQAAYDRIQTQARALLGTRSAQSLQCTVRTLAGCMDSEVSYDGDENGQFTAALLATWDFGRFRGDYGRFHREIVARVGTQQTPQHNVIGAPNPDFDAQRPFRIDGAAARALGGAARAGPIELEVQVSELNGVHSYGFAYAGAPVGMNGGKGVFSATSGQPGLLEWVMLGDPGGTMKVEVMRDGAAIKTRSKSEIVPPFGRGFDAFEISLS